MRVPNLAVRFACMTKAHGHYSYEASPQEHGYISIDATGAKLRRAARTAAVAHTTHCYIAKRTPQREKNLTKIPKPSCVIIHSDNERRAHGTIKSLQHQDRRPCGRGTDVRALGRRFYGNAHRQRRRRLHRCSWNSRTPEPASSECNREADSQWITIAIRGRQEPTANKMTARTIKSLELLQQSVPRDISQYVHLRHIKNACFTNAKHRVLIGTDNWHLIVSRQLSLGKKNEPAASRTDLGWVIYGTIPRLLLQNEDDTALHIHIAERREEVVSTEEPSSDDRLHELVKKHFAVNALGISLNTKVKPADQRAVEIFNQTARRVNHHYEEVEKKMDRDPQFIEDVSSYIQQIQNLIKKLS